MYCVYVSWRELRNCSHRFEYAAKAIEVVNKCSQEQDHVNDGLVGYALCKCYVPASYDSGALRRVGKFIDSHRSSVWFIFGV